MEVLNNNNKKLKEVKSSKRSVESAIKLFGPANVTSILDRDTYGHKLALITTRLETYLEKSGEAIEELEELRNDETEIECDKKIDDINILTEAIIKKVNDNEGAVKKKIEEVIRNYEDNRNSSKPSEMPKSQSSRMGTTENTQDHSQLSDKIAEYCETGPFLTHLPQFIFGAKYVISQYQKKIPIFG